MSNSCKHRAPPGTSWEEIYPILLNYAVHVTLGYNAPSKSISLPKGNTPGDMVNQAISKYFDRTRKWNPAKVDFIGFLKGIIRSDINHLYTSSETKTQGFRFDDDRNGQCREIASTEFPHPDDPLQFEQLIDAVASQLTEPLEQEIFEYIISGHSRKEILDCIKTSSSTYARILKKIQIIFNEILSESIL